jgi:hypothetical protein
LLLSLNSKPVPMRSLSNASLHLLHKMCSTRNARMRRNADRQVAHGHSSA